MDIIKLHYVEKRNGAGNLYECLLTDELNCLFDKKNSFKLCKNSAEPILRLEYNGKGIGDLSGKSIIGSKVEITKCNLYLGSLSTISELSSVSNTNKLYRTLNNYIGKTFTVF